jgi:prepilin-type N-terminal cleavage/methylation domain-containing protein
VNSRKGFTLVEILIVIAVASIVSVLIITAIDPVAKMKQGRDAKRRSDMNQLANTLRYYESVYGQYPAEAAVEPTAHCDSSIGRNAAANCPISPAGPGWDTSASSYIYQGLVTQGFLKSLATDPVNSTTYYYMYNPRSAAETPCPTEASGKVCKYWIGTMLEKPADPLKPIFRCSDRTDLAAGAGCKEVGGDIITNLQ